MSRWAPENVEGFKCQSCLLHPLTSLICVLHTHTLAQQTHTKSKLPEGGRKTERCRSLNRPQTVSFHLQIPLFTCLPVDCLLPSRPYLGLTHTFSRGILHLPPHFVVLSWYKCFSHSMTLYLFIFSIWEEIKSENK